MLSDSIPELSEGFIIYLEVDRANTDPRDLSRLQFLNRHILAVIEDDDGGWITLTVYTYWSLTTYTSLLFIFK